MYIIMNNEGPTLPQDPNSDLMAELRKLSREELGAEIDKARESGDEARLNILEIVKEDKEDISMDSQVRVDEKYAMRDKTPEELEHQAAVRRMEINGSN